MEKQINSPKLRFPEFLGNWKSRKFGDLYNFKTTNSFSRDNLNYDDGEVKNIHYGDIHTKFNSHFDVTKEKVPFVNYEMPLHKLTNEQYLKVGDLIIADASEDYADIGKTIEVVNLNNEKVIAGLHTLHASPDLKDLAIGFGGHLLKSENLRLQIKIMAQGTKVLSITTSRLSNAVINVPSISEQTKIANFLTAVDYKLTQLKKKKNLLEQYKKGVMQQIFSQELRFKNDDGSDFEEWEEKKLGEIATFINGKAYKQEELLAAGKYPVLRVGNFFSNNSWYYSDLELGKDKYCKNGDLLYAWSASFGPKIWDGDKTIYHYHIWKVICSKMVQLKYLFYVLDEQTLKMKTNNSNGFALIHITKGTIESWSISLPSVPEQTKIANFLSAIDEKITNEELRIKKMEGWKKGLLQGMFV